MQPALSVRGQVGVPEPAGAEKQLPPGLHHAQLPAAARVPKHLLPITACQLPPAICRRGHAADAPLLVELLKHRSQHLVRSRWCGSCSWSSSGARASAILASADEAWQLAASYAAGTTQCGSAVGGAGLVGQDKARHCAVLVAAAVESTVQRLQPPPERRPRPSGIKAGEALVRWWGLPAPPFERIPAFCPRAVAPSAHSCVSRHSRAGPC